MRRCLIFNEYFPVLGGGERYLLALGDIIAESHAVTYAGTPPDPARVRQLGFPTIEVTRLTAPEFSRRSAEFDLAVVITTTVPTPSFATKSLAVVQFPRGGGPAGNPVYRRMVRSQLRPYHCIVYSDFARGWLQQRWKVDGDVLMPAVVLADGRCEAKENLILSVGRFVGRPSDAWNSKRQDALIAAFSQLPLHLRRSWRLVLAGAAARSPAMDEYLDKLRQQAAGLNVSIETDVTPERLSSLQSRARLFWHAAGFERPRSLPEGAEHFGVATVEAMSHRAIPLVYADGGQLEIVSPQFGRLWTSIPDLVDKSVTLMEQSSAELDGMGDAARSASSRFGARRFEAEARELLNRLRIRQAPKRRAQLADTQRRKARSSIYRTKVRLYSVVSRLYRKSTGALRSNRTSALRSPEGA